MMPPKLVTLVANYLARLLYQAINNSTKKDCFPKIAKVVSVTPVDEKKDVKNSVLNFRPISVLNFISKIYENILKHNSWKE